MIAQHPSRFQAFFQKCYPPIPPQSSCYYCAKKTYVSVCSFENKDIFGLLSILIFGMVHITNSLGSTHIIFTWDKHIDNSASMSIHDICFFVTINLHIDDLLKWVIYFCHLKGNFHVICTFACDMTRICAMIDYLFTN